MVENTATTTTGAPSIPGLRHILRIPGKLTLAHPSLPVWRKEEGGHVGKGGVGRGRENDVGVVAGRAENLIANTFHSPANFKPISSVYCQSQRAQNSSLSVRNEILPVVPFRRSPCPFDLHWRRLDNLRIPLAPALLYLNANISFNAGERFTMAGADRRFRYVIVSMRFKYFAARRYQSRLIESGQFADAFYVSNINSAQGRMIESSSFIVIFLDSLHWPAE